MNSLKEAEIEVKWNEVNDLVPPSVGPFYTLMNIDDDQPMERTRTYQLTVFVQGDLDCACPLGELKHELVFLTVHDVGTNPPNSFIKFVNSPPMAYLKEKSVWLHVCVPGQEPGAIDFHGNFPSMNNLGRMLPQVLDHFGLTRCIAMGEGAGADVVCRFALENPDSVAGVILIHCTSTTHGILENLKEIFASLRIEYGKMSDTAWDYLMAHKLGKKYSGEFKKLFIEQIHDQGLNEHNLSQYLHAFGNRDDFTTQLEIQSAKFDTILVTGGKSPHNKNIFHMFDHMDKGKTGLMVAEGIVDLLAEAPEYLCETVNLLCQRHIHANILPDMIDPMAEKAAEMSESKAKVTFELTPPNSSPANGRSSTPLAKPAIHRDHPMGTESKTSSAPSMPSVPQPKPSKLIGYSLTAAIPQNPEEYLPEKYAQRQEGGAFPQNPADLLPPTQLIIPEQQSMGNKCGSSLSEKSNFQCQYCGRECCWCRDIPPGLPLE